MYPPAGRPTILFAAGSAWVSAVAAGSCRRQGPDATLGRTGLRAERLFERHMGEIARRTDRLFAGLLACQWVAAVAVALLYSPLAWDGETSRVHAHVWAATLLGGAIVGLPFALALSRAGATSTRHVIAAAQAMMGALLIHLTGGRIETHFHIFGSLALLAFYRDWRVLVTASVVVALDHLVRGLYLPESVFGVLTASPWRWAEHTGWVAAEDVFLIYSCLQNVREMRDVDEREADLSRANEGLAREVAERRRAEEAQARMVALLEATTDFVGIADAGGRALYVNAAGLSMVGLTEEDIPRMTISDFHPAWAYAIIARRGLPAAVRDGVWAGETALLRRDGGEVPVSNVIVAHKDAHGRVEYFSTIARDVTERKRTEREIRLLNTQLERRLSRLNALRQIDTAITCSFDLDVTLSTVLDQVIAQLGVDAADILLLDPGDRTLRYATGRGFSADSMTQVPPSLEQSVPGRVASECAPLHLARFTKETPLFARTEAMAEEGFVAYSAVPLVSQGTVKGVLEVFHRAPLEVDDEWIDFLGALAGQAAIAVDSARLFEDLQRSNAEMTVAYDATIEGWSRALDLRDKETEGHTRRVTEMSLRLARAMGVAGADLINVRRGALLHDVGKLGVPDAILLKPGKLTEEEWAVMRRHPSHAYEWLAPIAFLRPALDIPHCHHEKWDGTGYPRGLKGEEIPLAARAFAAVDVWDALRSDRPYRKGWPVGRVIEHLRSLSGTHLDPAVVAAFLRCLAGVPTVAEDDAPDAGEALAVSLPDAGDDCPSVGRNVLIPGGARGAPSPRATTPQPTS